MDGLSMGKPIVLSGGAETQWRLNLALIEDTPWQGSASPSMAFAWRLYVVMQVDYCPSGQVDVCRPVISLS